MFRPLSIFLFAVISLASENQSFANICNVTLGGHNVSGSYYIMDEYLLVEGEAPDPHGLAPNIGNPAWAISVDEYSGLAQTNVWFQTDSRNYSDDRSLGFDACAWTLSNFPASAIIRAQDDTGDCQATLSASCIDAIYSDATNSALKRITSTAGSNSSTTQARDVNSICADIASDVGSEDNAPWPKECWEDFGYNSSAPAVYNPEFEVTSNGDNGLQWFDYAITGSNATSLDASNCYSDNGTEQPFKMWLQSDVTASALDSGDSYANHVRDLYMTLTVWFDDVNANGLGNGSKAWAAAKLVCPRATNYNRQSRIVSPLTNSTLSGSSTSGKRLRLSAGAIAGLAVGCVLFLVLVAAIAAFSFFSRRKTHRMVGLEAAKLSSSAQELEINGTVTSELRLDGWREELHDKEQIFEKFSSGRMELAGDDVAELSSINYSKDYKDDIAKV